MSIDVKYTTSAIATGGRDGTARTLDDSFSIIMSTPKELGGAGGEGNNPEQLFAAGYAACFIGAMKFVQSQNPELKVSSDATVTAKVGIGPRAAGGFGLTVALIVSVPGLDREQAKELVHKAHEVCPYSNATRNNIDVKLDVV
ncbi:organic hydroperoxide resistance protein [Kangiella sp. HZ709]|uniref:organic hydroperoxide resistance protein n=1 Tax=Kangiella sp. HZ709 TaxID=2666328 RepID=UPI0012B0026A|nr:organic hydroperoxide resistance protein [Kangiella sp. HZ709]MRX26601.1 Ohr family peroxiredoxin [Kangiella sp. HZ709]